MATVYSTLFDSSGNALQPTRTPHQGVFHRKATYTFPTTGDGTTANDIIQMIPVSKGTTVLDLILTVEDIDTNGSATVVFDVGDGDDVDRYMDGITTGQAGGVATIGASVAAAAVDGVFFTYTADDTIDIKVVTAAATKAAGVVTLVAILSMEQD